MRLITKKYVKKLEENVKVREQRRMEESRVETVYIVRPNHLNAAGRLFGGTCCNYRTSDLCWEYFYGSACGYICGR